MGTLRKIIMKYLAYDWPDRLLLLEALFLLGFSRLLLLTVPFRWVSPHLSRQFKKIEQAQDRTDTAFIQRVGWAVIIVAHRTPWKSACLTQAMAAKWMLQRRQLPSTLYLGVDKEKNAPMQAHAWLSCNGSFLTGELGHQRFTVISSFSNE